MKGNVALHRKALQLWKPNFPPFCYYSFYNVQKREVKRKECKKEGSFTPCEKGIALMLTKHRQAHLSCLCLKTSANYSQIYLQVSKVTIFAWLHKDTCPPIDFSLKSGCCTWYIQSSHTTFLKISWKAAAGWWARLMTPLQKRVTWAQCVPILLGQWEEVFWQAKRQSNPSKLATENAAPFSVMEEEAWGRKIRAMAQMTISALRHRDRTDQIESILLQ